MVNKDSSPLLYCVVQFVQVQSKGSPSGQFLPFPVVPLSLEHFLACGGIWVHLASFVSSPGPGSSQSPRLLLAQDPGGGSELGLFTAAGTCGPQARPRHMLCPVCL